MTTTRPSRSRTRRRGAWQRVLVAALLTTVVSTQARSQAVPIPEQQTLILEVRLNGALSAQLWQFELLADGTLATSAERLRLLGFDLARMGVSDEHVRADLTFGNPHEMALPKLVESLKRRIEPRHVDWFAYKSSELEAREVVALALRHELALAFEPDDIAMTPGAFGAIGVALMFGTATPSMRLATKRGSSSSESSYDHSPQTGGSRTGMMTTSSSGPIVSIGTSGTPSYIPSGSCSGSGADASSGRS